MRHRPVGWLNDPNGLCQLGDTYHAFFQMSPFEPEGGLKFWGHCESKDLLHWDFTGVPMQPDSLMTVTALIPDPHWWKTERCIYFTRVM